MSNPTGSFPTWDSMRALESRLREVEAERDGNAEGLRYWNQRCVEAEREADQKARDAAKLLRARLDAVLALCDRSRTPESGYRQLADHHARLTVAEVRAAAQGEGS